MKISWIEADILAASSIPVSGEDIRSLHAQGIRAILTLTERPITGFKTISNELMAQLDIVYRHVPVLDQHPPDEAQALEILRFIDEMQNLKRPTLVHCHAGIGRTGT